MHAKHVQVDGGSHILEFTRLAMPLFFLLQFVTAQVFAFFMPDQLVIRRNSTPAQTSYVSRRVAIWIGPIIALILGVISNSMRSIPVSTLILVQAVAYLAMLYLYLTNLRGRRRE